MLVEGVMKDSSESLTCLFVDNSKYSQAIIDRIYKVPPKIIKKWRVFKPFIKSQIFKSKHLYDLAMLVLPKKYESRMQGKYDYKCTEFIRQLIDVSSGWGELRKLFSRKKRQITNDFSHKYGLQSRISNDINDFDFFYNRMFVPHIDKRFDQLSRIESYENMKAFFLQGSLLLVVKNDKILSAALFVVKNNTLIFRRTGVLDGDQQHVKENAQLALYYYQLKYAIKHNLQIMDTMKSRSFLNDGVYIAKKSWGARVCPDDESPDRAYFINNGSNDKMAKFFEINPLIVESKNGLKGVFGISGEQSESQSETKMLAKKLICRYQSAGINEFEVLTATNKIKLINEC